MSILVIRITVCIGCGYGRYLGSSNSGTTSGGTTTTTSISSSSSSSSGGRVVCEDGTGSCHDSTVAEQGRLDGEDVRRHPAEESPRHHARITTRAQERQRCSLLGLLG